MTTARAIVVGAGPAGATAARALALAGVETLLLDRARFPRHKPCGGAISARVVQRFPYLGPALSRIDTHWISRLHLESPTRRVVELQSATPAVLMIRRVEFDALLVSLAEEAGARLVPDADVVRAREDAAGVTLGTRDGREFRAPIVIACDGVHGVVARRLGMFGGWPRAAVAVDMMEETPNTDLWARDPDTIWVAYGFSAHPGLSHGYAYVFPKRTHVNVGLGYVVSHYRAAEPGTAYKLQQQFVADLTSEGVLDGRSRRDRFTPFLIPVAGPAAVTASGRVLVAGDAGGFVNGLTAEGIYYAMATGELAGRHAAAALARAGRRPAPDPSGYAAAWRAEFGAELRDSVLLQRYLFADRRRIDSVVHGATRHGALTEAIVRYAIGSLPYARARREVLRANPRLAVSLGWAALRRW